MTNPDFLPCRPIRAVTGSGVLADISSHMPAGNIYEDNDRVTSAHEQSHGISSYLRDIYGFGKKINAYYVLQDRAVIVNEFPTTLMEVVKIVPRSLQGMAAGLYLHGRPASDWNDSPSYYLDEWNAYINGSATRLDLRIEDRAESMSQAFEFFGYSTCVALASRSEDEQTRRVLMFQTERLIEIYRGSLNLGDCSVSTEYIRTLQSADDAKELREFCKNYYGAQWCSDTLGMI